MTFTPKSWQNDPATTTPISAAALIDLEARLSAYTDSIGAGGGAALGIWLDSYYDNATYANKTAAIQAAWNAAVAANTSLECQAGRVYSLDVGPLVISGRTNLNGVTTTATLSGAQTFPEATITCTAAIPSGFPPRGMLTVAGVSGVIYYTGISGSTFTGATGGVGSAAASAKVMLNPLSVTPLPKLTINGHGATFKSTWGDVQLIMFENAADYDVFCDIDIRDLTFDANKQVSMTQSSSVVGNVGAGVNNQRVSFCRMRFADCKWINVPLASHDGAPANNISCFSFISTHLGALELQTVFSHIHLERAWMRGGRGAFVMGVNSGTGTAEVYHDQLYLEVDHDSTYVPSATDTLGSASIQIGSQGFGDYCECRIKARNSSDVGIEIDAMQNAHVWGEIVDSKNALFYARNFHAPIDVITQKITLHSCKARVENIPPSLNYKSMGFALNDDGSGTSAGEFGTMVLENCTYYDVTGRGGVGAASSPLALGLFNVAAGTFAREIVIQGTFTAAFPKITDAASTIFRVCTLATQSNRFQLRGGRFKVILGGTVLSTNTIQAMRITPVSTSTVIIDLEEIDITSTLTGAGVGKTLGLVFNSLSAGGKVKGRIGRMGWGNFSGGDTAPILFQVAASTVVVIDGEFYINTLDLRNDPTAAQTVLVHNSDAANQVKIKVDHVIAGTNPRPASALTVGASPFIYQNLDSSRQMITISGGTVSAISYSVDGTNYFTVGTVTGDAYWVEPGHFLQVTYSVAPTMEKLPL